MQAFVVALEYRGAILTAGAAGPRAVVCQHAYDLETAALAGHPPAELPRAARCPDCDTAVRQIVRALIAATLSGVIRRRPGH